MLKRLKGAAENTLFSSAHGMVTRMDHTMGHKTSLGKFMKFEIISNVFSGHNTIRLEIDYMKKIAKNTTCGG